MTPTKIEQIWDELENDNSFAHGLLIRRYTVEILPDVFVGIKSPEGFRCIAVLLPQHKTVNIASFSNLRDISVEIIKSGKNENGGYLVFMLLNPEHKDVFSILCEDLLLSIAPIISEEKLFKELLNRFEKWKSLFERAFSQGLNPEKQRGLFGELIFLRKYFTFRRNFLGVLNSWVGPSAEAKDFQMNSWALEVKTTLGNNIQKVQISSERQLDSTHLGMLFLYHISLETLHETGESLNQIIDSITNILAEDTYALHRFKAKLMEAGYFDHHRFLYDSSCYIIKQDIFYLVKDAFPRIQENEIRNGVGEVKYSIVLSACKEYEYPEDSVFANLIL